MTLLNDAEIREACSIKHVIFPFAENQLQPASYDVTLGRDIVRFEPGINGFIDASTKMLVGCGYHDYRIPEDGDYTLDPGEFILGTTVETVHIPPDLASRFEGKSSLGRLGLATHVTAGFIDPGFQGQITLEIKNMNNVPIVISPGMRIGQLCFFRVDPVERPYGDEIGSHYQNQVGPTVACVSE